jgi:hypothetical protein
MGNADGLDRWIEDDKKPSSKFSKSLFPHEQITLHSLKERIVELEKMRDQILYELDKLKALKADSQMARYLINIIQYVHKVLHVKN